MNRNENPWKGLDSYQETDRLYGRDDEVEELMSRIEYNVQTVLYSRTGIGKSSILKAGIYPKARKVGMFPVSIRLQHTTNPEESIPAYSAQIIRSLEEELRVQGGVATELVPHRGGHEEELWEYLHRHTFSIGGEKVIPLLVLDQFEEIFTLEKNVLRVSAFFAQVADLLNGIVPEYLTSDDPAETPAEVTVPKENIFISLREKHRQQEAPYLKTDEFRIIFSLREDYLSYLEQNTTRIPSMKLNRYCLLPINEEQAATIIMEPRPGLVSQDVAYLIIKKVTGETDFQLDGHPSLFVDSAILSLYLSRLYDKMPEGSDCITAELVDRFGDNIIQDFYLDAIRDVRTEIVEYLEDNLLTGEGRRENVSLYNATHIGGMTPEELRLLCDERRLLRRFYYGGSQRVEFVHDILCPVVKDRRDTRSIMKVQEEERRKILEKAQADRRRYQRWIAIGSALLLLILLGWLRHQYLDIWTCNRYYESFVQVNGWPVGVGRNLGKKAVSRYAVVFKLSKHGFRASTPFDQVEVMSPDDELLHNNRRIPLVRLDETSDVQANAFGSMMNNTKYYRFSSTETVADAHVSKYEACDIDGNTLYVVTYFKASSQGTGSGSGYQWAVFTDGKGTPLKLRDNGADRMQIFLNAAGQEEKYMFFDENGAPRRNDLDCFGYRMSYNDLNQVDTVWALDPFGNEEFFEVRNYSSNQDSYTFYDLQGAPINHKRLHYHRRIETKDAKGRVIGKEYFGPDGRYVSDRQRPARSSFVFDDCNRVISSDFFNGAGEPYSANSRYYARREYEYIGHSMDLLSENSFRWNPQSRQMEKVYNYYVLLFGSVNEYYSNNLETGEYHMRRIEHNEDAEPVSISYYGQDDKPQFDSTDNFHKHIIERKALRDGRKIVVHRYYDVDGSLFADVDHGYYAIDSCIYNANDLLLSRVCYDKDTSIVKSQGYEYNDGVEVSRYARGVHGTPIRCARWERDGLCYYRLSIVKSGMDALSYVKPISEYGGTSWAYDGTDPFGIIERRGEQIQVNDIGSTWQRVSITTVFADHIPRGSDWVMYVHLLKAGSPADLLGLRDGDLLLQAGNWHYSVHSPLDDAATIEWARTGKESLELKVARYDIASQEWQLLTFSTLPEDLPFGAEIYPVYYTADEYKAFLTAFAQ